MEGVVDIPGVIQRLRQQRTKMVQTLVHYRYIALFVLVLHYVGKYLFVLFPHILSKCVFVHTFCGRLLQIDEVMPTESFQLTVSFQSKHHTLESKVATLDVVFPPRTSTSSSMMPYWSQSHVETLRSKQQI